MKEWSIFFLIKGSQKEQEPYISTMVREILQRKISEHVYVTLCIYCSVAQIRSLDTMFEPEAGLKETDKTTVFYKVSTIAASRYSTLVYITQSKKFDLKKSNDLKGFFREQILSKCLAKKYLLFTWDHGSSFGIFRDTPEPLSSHSQNSILLQGNDGKRSLELTENGSMINTDFDMLTMHDLQKAIKWAFAEVKIDLCIMMNCCMQYFDTGLTLSYVIKYLVAPETAIAYSGYNYIKIFDTLYNRPSISAKNLAKISVSSMKTKKYDDEGDKFLTDSYTSLFANKLCYYPVIAKEVNKLSIYLLKQLRKNKGPVIIARKKCDFATQNKLIDFYHFLNSLKLAGLQFFTIKAKLLFYKFLTRKEKFIGKNFYDVAVNKLIFPSCFSIFFSLEESDLIDNDFYQNFILENSNNVTIFSRYYCWNIFTDAFVMANEKTIGTQPSV